jgi:hypothetical protein
VGPPVGMSLLTGGPCEPPCWQGLTPGVSTEEDVNEFLRTSPLVNPVTVFRGSVTRNGEISGVSIQWLSDRNVHGAHARNSFLIEDDTLQDIIIYVDAEVTLAKLIDKYGPPEKQVAVLSGIHFTEVRLTVYYPQNGFTAHVELPRHDASTRPDTRITSVWYFKSAPVDTFLELGRDAGHFSDSVQPESLSDWKGYGPLEVD